VQRANLLFDIRDNFLEAFQVHARLSDLELEFRDFPKRRR
jgi:hypothetical protein